MHDIMRKRLMRKLEALPDEQLYQVLDYIEFLEGKYAAAAAVEPDGLQRFAERLEDRMRVRSLAPRALSGTMKMIGTAGRVWDNLAGAGQGILNGLESGFDLLRSEVGQERSRSEEARPAGSAGAPSGSGARGTPEAPDLSGHSGRGEERSTS